jgi:REP element-mobilizing transposase RayT
MRTPQKRFYIDEAVYFITAVTHRRHPFFRGPIFADLFVAELWFADKVKEFTLHGYTVTYDHVHLLVQPAGSSNISDVMGSLKRNVSRDINDLIQDRARTRSLAGDDSNRPLPEDVEYVQSTIDAMRAVHPALSSAMLNQHYRLLLDLRTAFWQTANAESRGVRFRWQKSFYDHIIRGDRDFIQHLEYVFGNAVKHKLTDAAEEWPWMWVSGMDQPKGFQ